MPESRRILFFVEGEPRHGLSPAARLRAYQYAPFFAAAGWSCVFLPSHPPKYFHNRYGLKRLRARARWLYQLALLGGWGLMCVTRLWQFRRVRRADVVVLQRPLLPTAAVFLEKRLARRNRHLIFDVDDAILELHAGQAQTILRLARRVVVATPYLRGQVEPFNPNVAVVATPVDPDAIKPSARRANDCPVIGWIGTSGNLPYLQPLAPVLRRLAATHRFRFRLVCNRASPGEYPDTPAEIIEWRLENETAELQALDIGIMPLRDDPWCRGKAGFKLLQYMAAGLPVVASPVGFNSELVQPGVNGYLADSPAEWEQALARLLADAALRRQLGQQGRALVEQEFSLRVSFAKLRQVIESA